MFLLRPRIAFNLLFLSSSFNYHHLLFPFSSSASFFSSVFCQVNAFHISKLNFGLEEVPAFFFLILSAPSFYAKLLRNSFSAVCLSQFTRTRHFVNPFEYKRVRGIHSGHLSPSPYLRLGPPWTNPLCLLLLGDPPREGQSAAPDEDFTLHDNIYSKYAWRDSCLIASGVTEPVHPCCNWQSGQLRWL